MRYPATILILALLTACQSSEIYVPVSQAGEHNHQGARLYVVQHGDTLYSIAFRYGMDYKQLAEINNIHPPYMIYINERLRLGKLASQPAPEQDSAPHDSAAVARVHAPTTPTITAPDVGDASIQWHWPYDGQVVHTFSLSGKINKGIDIRGKPGAPVRSTAAGVVVYAGGGLRGYGKLVIVKHNDRYLSAYGHNESILVKEGQHVNAGQVVSRLGGVTGTEDLLHFEIRRDGKPQDPMQFLPQRGNAQG